MCACNVDRENIKVSAASDLSDFMEVRCSCLYASHVLLMRVRCQESVADMCAEYQENKYLAGLVFRAVFEFAFLYLLHTVVFE